MESTTLSPSVSATEESAGSSSQTLHRSVSIRGTPLLRGVSLPRLMRLFGAVLKDSRGTEETYSMSFPCDEIDDFISHTWSTGRVTKFLALAVHYNMVKATLAAWAVGLFFVGLTVVGRLPTDGSHEHPHTLASFLSGHVAFIIVFCFGQELESLKNFCFSRRPRTLFLDKVCIHQRDQELQKHGIRKLAGFLQASTSLVVVYSNSYLDRLWTMYELVSYFLFHMEDPKVSVIPVVWVWQYALALCGVAGSTLLYSLAYYTFPLHLRGSQLPNLIYLGTMATSWAIAGRLWERHRHITQDSIKTFSIRKTVCSTESDRDLVQANVCHFMELLGRSKCGDVEAALDEFDQAVRQELSTSLQASIGGHLGHPYRMLVATFMGFSLHGLDNLSAGIVAGCRPEVLASHVMYGFAGTFLMGPLTVFFCRGILAVRPNKKGVWDVLSCSTALIVGCLPWSVGWTLTSGVRRHGQLGSDAERSETLVWLIVTIFWYLVMVIVVAWVYSRCPTSTPAQRSTSAEAACPPPLKPDKRVDEVHPSKEDDVDVEAQEPVASRVQRPLCPRPGCHFAISGSDAAVSDTGVPAMESNKVDEVGTDRSQWTHAFWSKEHAQYFTRSRSESSVQGG